MTSLEEYKEAWKKDCKIDDVYLADEALNVPKLHAKYLDYYSAEKNILTNLYGQYYKVFKERREYYSGKATSEVYKEEPLDLKVMKSELPHYLDSDEKLQKYKKALEKQKTKIEYLESVLDQIRQRNWHIRNAIDWKKFTMGE